MGHFNVRAPHSIAIFRALQLGDLLCAVPALRSLRAAFPLAQISLVGLPWAKTFVQRFSRYLDDFIEFPGWPGLPEIDPALERIPGFIESMQQRHFDLALQMQGSGAITNPMVTLFGAQQTAGFYLPGQYRPNEKLFMPYPEGSHEIRILLSLLEFLGIPAQGDAVEFPVTDEERKIYKDLGTLHQLEAGRYIILHPGARFVGRRWTPEKFAAVGDELGKMGFRIVVTGTNSERALTRAVVQNMHLPALDLAGKTDLGTLAQLIANANLLISNDTGVSHIAAACQTPSVILFTASDPERWRPPNRQLHRVVINALDAAPQSVIAEAEHLLQEGHRYANNLI